MRSNEGGNGQRDLVLTGNGDSMTANQDYSERVCARYRGDFSENDAQKSAVNIHQRSSGWSGAQNYFGIQQHQPRHYGWASRGKPRVCHYRERF